ncbi:MAG: M23 family metallopeptidase [Cyanobacteria bacterium P01_A01_bin.17]
MRIVIETNGPPLHYYLFRLIPLMLILWPAANAAGDHFIDRYKPRLNTASSSGNLEPTYLREGDRIAGYEVTSPYLPHRLHPVTGERLPHYGVDVATPVGTRVMAPNAIKVVCWWDSKGGGEVATVTDQDGDVYKLLHLSSCISGPFDQGETFARTGNTGLSTGPHLDVRRGDKAEPSQQEIEPFLTGKPSVSTSTHALSDHELTCAIGAAEGTRNSDCTPNEQYNGHIDPGNGAHNLGTFSYQHGADSPAEADRKQLRRLRRAEKDLQAQADEKWGKPLSKVAITTALDLWNQSPKAGNDFVHHLPRPAPSAAEIVDARTKAYVDPDTGQLDAPGLGNDSAQVERDQARRTDAVIEQLAKEKTLQRQRLEQLDK